MHTFEWIADEAIPSEEPINAEAQFGDGYKQVTRIGTKRTWRLRFLGDQRRLADIIEALKSHEVFMWKEPAPHQSDHPHMAKCSSWSSKEHNGQLQEVSCVFVLKYDNSLFGGV